LIKLVKSELYKILHKKLLYVLVIISAIFTIISGVADKIYENNSNNNNLEIIKTKIDNYESMGDRSSYDYLDSKTTYDIEKLIEDKNIKEESPEEYYVRNNLYSYIYNYYFALSQDISTNGLKNIKDTMDVAINKLDNFDWKEIIQEELKEINETVCEDKSCEELKNEKLKVANYRLENNIPKSSNIASTTLEMYIGRFSEYQEVKDKNEDLMKYSEKYSKRSLEKEIKPIQYMIDNKLFTNDYKDNGFKWTWVVNMGEAGTIVAIALLALSATIVAEEFNKGTIKQLLVKPYSRTKIIISKMLAVLITAMLFKIIICITTLIIEALFEGNILTVFGKHVIYNFNTGKCISISYFTEGLLAYIYSLPEIILLGIFVFAVSVVSTNTALSLGLGFGAFLSAGIFELMLGRFKFLSFSPTLNYNLNQYLFGNISEYEVLTLHKAIAVDIVSFIVLFVLILVVFNKKDIKNQ